MGEKLQWARAMEFMMAMMSFAIGLGNIWRFPYMCFKFGGGMFLIPYIFGLIVVGFPILYLEVALGQFTGSDSIKCWDISPIFRGIGYSCLFISLFVGSYYNLLVAIFIQYLYYSLRKNLVWSTCNNSWNQNCTLGTATTEFFHNKVLQKSDSIVDMGHNNGPLLGTYALAWIIVYLCLIKSIKTVGKVAYVTTILPYFIMTVLLIRGVTLKGSKEGLYFYLYPDFSQIKRVDVWYKAATQIFYSLSTCTGGIITLASFNKHDNNFLRDVIFIGIANSFTSFYCGFAIFSATGHLAYLSNKSVIDVTTQTTELAFISYPASISTLPGAPVWAALFYIMMIFLGIGTMIGNTEGLITPVENIIPNLSSKSKMAIRFGLCFLSFLIGIPLTYQGGFYYVDIYDDGTSGGYLWVGLAELICLMYIYDFRRFITEIELMIGKRPGRTWKIYFVVISPLCGVIMLISNYAQYSIPDVAIDNTSKSVNVLINTLCVIPMPIYAIGYCIYCYMNKINILRPTSGKNQKSAVSRPL